MNWPVVKLQDIFEIARGGSPRPIDKFITDEPDGLNWISIKDASNSSKYIYKTKLKIKKEGLKKTRLVNPGDFLLTNSMSFGRPYIMKTSGCIHDGWLVLSADSNKVDPDYFYYLLGSDLLKSKFESLAKGAVVKNLNIDLVKSVEIPLPPLETQKQIAAILEKADQLRKDCQQMEQELNNLAQSVFMDMFGDPVSNPKGWRKANLADFIVEGPTNGLYKHSDHYGQGTPIIRIDSFYQGRLEASSKFKLVSITNKELEKFKVQNRGVLINRVNSPEYLGKAAFIDELSNDTVYESNMMYFRVNELMLNPRYLVALLSTGYMKTQIRRCSKDAVNQSSINQGDVKSFEVIVPDVHSQNRYENFMKVIDKEMKLVSGYRRELNENFDSLIDRAFKGELNVNNKAA